MPHQHPDSELPWYDELVRDVRRNAAWWQEDGRRVEQPLKAHLRTARGIDPDRVLPLYWDSEGERNEIVCLVSATGEIYDIDFDLDDEGGLSINRFECSKADRQMGNRGVLARIALEMLRS